ncbi:hypothetical protein B0H34DRAFT_789768 [Crassisporium funariophilum]|nr:hypothetical protein B0H34DRAFT_789768 [Crassisporium funariophilum]
MSLASWYHQQYHTWNRTRRLAQSPFLARTGTNTSQAATAMAAQQVNGGAPQTGDVGNLNAGKDKKSSEPLFGPSIGSVSSGPAWTMNGDKKVVTDELTPEIVSGWVEKSKEPLQPTTTLQALVNLKRPTLRLSPLASVPDDPSTANVSDQHHHGLEFEYDCDAPKCGIYVHVYLPKNHPDAPTSMAHSLGRLLVFETVVDGGFGNHLKLEEGAMLELGRFEHANGSDTPAEPSSSGELAPTTAMPAIAETGGNTPAAHGRNRRRFTHFHFRRRSQNRSISGPALAVVDAEPVQAQEGVNKNGKDGSGKEEVEEGVKVTIRLAALDEQGTELASPNEQITYLHIVRFGAKAEGVEAEEDARPWVVKVVKREATIGPHTFHLHEIYGLTSSSHATTTTTVAPTSPSITHTYPPEDTHNHLTIAGADDDDPQSECLLCLSSPREVVLLPCRHLVACKDCALNMVEFGAGGTITQAVDAGAEEGGEAGAGTAAAAGVGVAAAPVTPTAATRRKRKAKGWFCPVCRQPYTSMLRITTSAPSTLENKGDNEGSGTEDEATPDPAVAANQNTAEVRSGGLLGAAAALRPGFLRGLSLRSGGGASASASVGGDVEREAGLGRVGA